MKWADYCITKLSLNSYGLIESIIIYDDLGNKLENLRQQNRSWMVQQVNKGKTFCSIKKNEMGSWSEIGDLSYNGSTFEWYSVPENISKRKAFLSYYHKDDQEFKEKFTNLFSDLIIEKSVNDGDIDSDNSDEYIKKLIQQNHLEDTTLLIVLLGPNTKHRKHIDWEISGALNLKVGERYSGLLGLKLPSHQDFGTGSHTYSSLPERLSDNLKSGYAHIGDWTDDRIKMQKLIEGAFSRRSEPNKITNGRIQMTENTNE